jgi:hypothetical protein
MKKGIQKYRMSNNECSMQKLKDRNPEPETVN